MSLPPAPFLSFLCGAASVPFLPAHMWPLYSATIVLSSSLSISQSVILLLFFITVYPGVHFLSLSQFYKKQSKSKLRCKCSQKDTITACSKATALQLHLPGIILSPVTMLPGSSPVMQLLKEASSPSARRPLLRDLWLPCHVIRGGLAEGFYVRHAAFITFEFWWLISSQLALQTGVGTGHRKIHFANFLRLKVTVLLGSSWHKTQLHSRSFPPSLFLNDHNINLHSELFGAPFPPVSLSPAVQVKKFNLKYSGTMMDNLDSRGEIFPFLSFFFSFWASISTWLWLEHYLDINTHLRHPTSCPRFLINK